MSRRLGQAMFVLWLAATFVFAAMQLAPGDPAQVLLAASGASAEQIAVRRAELGLDDPLWRQYVRYLGDLLRGDLGTSWLHGRAVSRMILEQAPATALLALSATMWGTVCGVLLGTAAALRRCTWVDRLATMIAALSLSTPTYFSGILAILLFSLRLRWLPPVGAPTGEGGVGRGTYPYIVLPTLVLGFALLGSIARLVRARVIEVLDEPFVTAAHARGLPAWRVTFVHVLRAALAPAVALIALQLGFLLGGAVVTESVFARRGLGKLALEAILWRDLPVVRGVVLFAATAYVLVSLAADLVQTWLDPRLREVAG